MAFALAQALLLADAITPDALGEALYMSATRGASLVRSLQALGTLEPLRLEQQLEKGDAPAMRHVAPVVELVERLPPGLCERLVVLPVRQDPRTGTVDVAVVDARDPHAADEVAFWLGAPVRLVRTSLASMDAAFRRLEERPSSLGMEALAPPIGSVPPPPPDEGAAPGPNIPIPLTRRNSIAEIQVPPAPFFDRGADAESAREPVLNLARRKPTQTSLAPAVPPPPAVSVPPAVPPRPVSRGPITQRGPFAPSAASVKAASAPAASLAPVASAAAVPTRTLAPSPPPVDAVAELRSAHDRDRVVDLLVTGTRTVAARVAVLAVRRDTLVGWSCSAEIADPVTFKKVTLATGTPTVLTEVIDQGGAWLARFPHDLAHAPLLEMLKQGGGADEVVIAGVRVEGRAALVVLGAGLTDTSKAKKHVAELAIEAGEALGRVLRERRK